MAYAISVTPGNRQPDGRRIMTVRATVPGAEHERAAIDVNVTVFVQDQDSNAGLEAHARQVARETLQQALASL